MGKLTDQQRADICKTYQIGVQASELAKQYGVSQQSIRKLLIKSGVHQGTSRPHLSPAEIDTVVGLYRDKQASIESISEVVGRSTAAISRALRSAGILLGKADGRLRQIPQVVRDRAVLLYQTGMSAEEIAVLGLHPKLSKTVVYDELKRRGVTARGGGARGVFFNQPEKQQEIIKQYADGMSASQLAELNGCSIDPIFKILRDADIEIRDFDAATGLEWTDGSGRTRTMRSMWEIKAAKYLDAGGRKWDYEKEHYDIGDGHVYTPDFWIYADDGVLEKIVDVKGWLRPESAAAIEKFKACYPALPFELWDEIKLTELGVLLISLKGEPIKLAPNHVAGRQPMPQSEKDGIASLYINGLTVVETAAKSGRSHSTVEEILTERKLLRGKHRSRLLRVPQEVRDQVVDAHSMGKSLDEISKELNVGRDIVAGEIARRGVHCSRPRLEPLPEDMEAAVALYVSGVSLGGSVKRSNVSYYYLRNELVRRDLLRAQTV